MTYKCFNQRKEERIYIQADKIEKCLKILYKSGKYGIIQDFGNGTRLAVKVNGDTIVITEMRD